MSAEISIAIDGPSGTGKSSVSRQVAALMGFGYLDTGAMYRALAWWCLDQRVDVHQEEAVVEALGKLDLHMEADPTSPDIFIGGYRVNRHIRTNEVAGVVSTVAGHLRVRPLLQKMQADLMRDIARETGGVVAEGRDVTTVVAPEADVRILLTAPPEVRMARRGRQLARGAQSADRATLEALVVERDRADSQVSEFHNAASGVLTIDTSEMTLDEVVAQVYALAQKALTAATAFSAEPVAEKK